MKFIDNRGVTDAAGNLALEEYVLRNAPADETYLLFYINSPSIIIGRNQNTVEEINPDYVRERGVQVVRRISGGGAVYHDTGNLNFSFQAPYARDRFNRYEEFTRPILEVLHELGVPAELSGRNDIIADGRKISGNAQFVTQRRMFSHGTLLFDSDLDSVGEALRVKASKIESKGVKSVRSRVANISEFLREPLTIDEFRGRILERAFGTRHDPPMLELTAADWDAVEELRSRKYASWDWNFGESPAFNVQRVQRFPIGEIDVRIEVSRHGRIENVRIFGDFMNHSDLGVLEDRLRGVQFDPPALARALDGIDLTEYFGDLAREEFLALLYV